MKADNYYAARPCRNERAWKKDALGHVVVRTEFNRLLCLTPLGSDIFLLCGGKKNTMEIVAFLEKKYPTVPGEEIAAEVRGFLSFMQSMGVLMIDHDNF